MHCFDCSFIYFIRYLLTSIYLWRIWSFVPQKPFDGDYTSKITSGVLISNLWIEIIRRR